MERYRLDRNNKYRGRVEIDNSKEVASGVLKAGKIKIFSVAMVLMLSLSSVYAIADHFSEKADDVYYLCSHMSYNGDKIRVNFLNYRSKYKKIEEEYNNMSNEEKCNYVVSVFNGLIEGSDEFTDEEKQFLKEKEGEYLGKYGYNKDFDKIFGSVSRLKKIVVKRDVSLGVDCLGNYSLDNNTIGLEYGSDVKTLAHELDHANTVDDVNEGIKNGYYYIMESMNSCKDVKYYSNDTYHDRMRTHMLFLSKIIGVDNMIKVYENSDFELLEKLIGDQYEELIELFGEQHELILNGSGMDAYYCDAIAEKLKDIYEKKNHCWLEESDLMNTIYQASKLDSYVTIYTTLFDDVQKYSQDADLVCFDDDYLAGLRFENNDNDIKVVDGGILDKGLNSIDKNEIDDYICFKKLNYLLPDKVVKKVINSSNPEQYLSVYLKELGVRDANFWTYNILNDLFPIFCCEEGFYYENINFNKDLNTILRVKYQELKEDDKLYELYDNFDVFYFNKNNVDEDRFREFCKDVVNYDKDLSVDDIINSSNRSKENNSRKHHHGG